MRTTRFVLLLVAVLFLFGPALVAQDDSHEKIPDDQKREFLLTAKIVDARKTAKGITSPWRLTLDNGAFKHDAAFQAIDERKATYQTNQGTELNFRDSWHFDVAAYEIAKLLGLDSMMPVTVERVYRGDHGALSWWIPKYVDEIERRKQKLTPPDLDGYNNAMYRQRVFGQLVYDTDRNLTNVLMTLDDGKLWMIDFTRAFRLSNDLKDVKDLEKCDKQLFEKLKALTAEQVKQAVGKHLEGGQINALLKRRDKIVAQFTKMAADKGEAAIFY